MNTFLVWNIVAAAPRSSKGGKLVQQWKGWPMNLNWLVCVMWKAPPGPAALSILSPQQMAQPSSHRFNKLAAIGGEGPKYLVQGSDFRFRSWARRGWGQGAQHQLVRQWRGGKLITTTTTAWSKVRATWACGVGRNFRGNTLAQRKSSQGEG